MHRAGSLPLLLSVLILVIGVSFANAVSPQDGKGGEALKGAANKTGRAFPRAKSSMHRMVRGGHRSNTSSLSQRHETAYIKCPRWSESKGKTVNTTCHDIVRITVQQAGAYLEKHFADKKYTDGMRSGLRDTTYVINCWDTWMNKTGHAWVEGASYMDGGSEEKRKKEVLCYGCAEGGCMTTWDVNTTRSKGFCELPGTGEMSFNLADGTLNKFDARSANWQCSNNPAIQGPL